MLSKAAYSDRHEDVIQETYIRLVHYAPVFQSEAQLRTWLAKTVRSVVINLGRRRREIAHSELVENTWIDPPVDPESDNETLTTCFRKLSEEDQGVLVLR